MADPHIEEFAVKLRQRIGRSDDLTYVRSDKYMLLGEVLISTPELQAILELAGVEVAGAISFNKENGKAALSSAITNFIEQMVETYLPDGEKVFDYWADTGVGSWIRLAQSGRRQYGQNRRYNANGSSNYQNGSRGNWDGMKSSNGSWQPEPTQPPAEPSPAPPATSSFLGSRALPGWVTRAQGGADGQVSAPVIRPPPAATPASSSSPAEEARPVSGTASAATFLSPTRVPADTANKEFDLPPPPPAPDVETSKKNKASNKMKAEATLPPAAPAEVIQAPPPTPKPPPASLLRQASPPRSPIQPPPPRQEPSSPVPKAPAPPQPKEEPVQLPIPGSPPHEQAKVPDSAEPLPWEQPLKAPTRLVSGVLRSYQRDRAVAVLALSGGQQVTLRASAFEGDIPQELGAGWQVEAEVEELGTDLHVLRAKVTGAPVPSKQENNNSPAEEATTKRGRFKTFMLDKGFGFCLYEDGPRNVDVFVHCNSVEGTKPDDFPGLPGMPAVGQEIEFKLGDNTARPRATWARIVGPALPMDKGKVLSMCLSFVLKKSADFIQDPKKRKAGWFKLSAILAMDQMRAAVTAHSPDGMVEIKQGLIPEPLMNSLHDLAVCVVAPSPEAAAEAIAGNVPSTAESVRDSPDFHLWMEQEVYSVEDSQPQADRLWIRLAQSSTRGFQAAKTAPYEKEKSWWEGGGGTSRPEAWEPQHLKALCTNPLGDCTADDILKVLGALPVDAPSEVRRYLEAWEKRMRLK